MGTVLRKQYTQPLPRGAEIVERDGKRIAMWRLRNGEKRSGEVIEGQGGRIRVRGRSQNYVARYRDGAGHMVEIATDCRDPVAARAVLVRLERQAELIRSGVLAPEECDAANHATARIATHLDAYERHLKAKGGAPRRIAMLRARLDRIVEECGFTHLGKFNAGRVERWLLSQQDAGRSAATRNVYRESLIGFGNWCRRTHRLTINPFADLPRADQNSDRPHRRRALTEAELVRLLRTARLRPLAEFGREVIHKKRPAAKGKEGRATWKRQPLRYEDLDAAVARARGALKDNPALMERLEHQGRERYLIYRTLALTGLRRGELASLRISQIELDTPTPIAVLNAADEKNRDGASIPLRADLVDEIRAWLVDRLEWSKAAARADRRPIPARLSPNEPLFDMPTGLNRIFDRDLAAAGIPKRDERDRVVDIHALRVTFCTHLCVAGVPLRLAQAAMRHSKPELTANIYTDPQLLDVAGAVNALPQFTPDASASATGTNPSSAAR